MIIAAFGDGVLLGEGDPYRLGWVGRALVGAPQPLLFNLGVGGDTSREIASRWWTEAAVRRRPGQPFKLLFSFGVCDCDMEAGALRVRPDETVRAARAILSEARALGPVLMVCPTPVVQAAHRARAAALGDALEAVAGQVGVACINPFTALRIGGLWEAEAAVGDGVHPGAEGYQHLAELMAAHPVWRDFADDGSRRLAH